MMKWIGILLLLSLAGGVLAACAPASQNSEAESPAQMQESGAVPTPRQGLVAVPSETPAESQLSEPAPVQPGAYGEAATPLVQQAQQDLSQRLGAPVDQIAIVSVSEVVWPDGSLGCPQPGQFYTQATMPGYQIILSYQGQEYSYHADMNRAFLCENLAPSAQSKKGNLAPELKLVNLAIDDLVQRLGVSREQVQPEPIAPKKWEDSSLGCPEPGQTYTPGEQTGYEITLKVKDQNNRVKKYIYHSDLERVVYCELP